MKTEKNTKRKTHSEKTFLVGSEPIHRMRLMIYFFLYREYRTFLDFSFCFFLSSFFPSPSLLFPFRVLSLRSQCHTSFTSLAAFCVFCSFSFYCCLFLFVIFFCLFFSPLLLLLLIPILFSSSPAFLVFFRRIYFIASV